MATMRDSEDVIPFDPFLGIYPKGIFEYLPQRQSQHGLYLLNLYITENKLINHMVQQMLGSIFKK